MALLRAHRDDPRHAHRDELTSQEVRTSASGAGNVALRAVGMVAAAIPLVIALVAAARLDWGDGFDAAAVSVAGMPFTPAVAIATGVVALIALAAAASPDRGSKLVMGAVLACVGAAILLAGGTATDLDLDGGHGWLALGVGVVLVAVGLAMRNGWWVREEVHRHDVR